jgi:anti-sigma regulatory factor (Ser/Thr protein kinase)
LAANSALHGRGRGVLRVWRDQDTLVCEVRDRGHIHDPLAGRHKPDTAQRGGWGLWIVNQVCDLVQVRTGADGTVVRVLMRLG